MNMMKGIRGRQSHFLRVITWRDVWNTSTRDDYEAMCRCRALACGVTSAPLPDLRGIVRNLFQFINVMRTKYQTTKLKKVDVVDPQKIEGAQVYSFLHLR